MDMTILTSVLFTLASCILEILFLRSRGHGNHRLALVLKALASLSFCLAGLLLARRRGWGFRITAGLFCGLLGDVLLGLRKIFRQHHDLVFTLGAAAFCVGHGCYIAALLSLQSGIVLPALPVFLLLTLGSELFARKAGFSQGKMHLPGLAYIAVEALLCALALVSFFRLPGIGTGLFALGGLSFLVSDNLLCAFSFGSLRSPATDRALHGTYLAAQLLIGWSILFL